MVAALASWLDARAHQGQWLVRIEDVDAPRCSREAETIVLRQLADCALLSDLPPVRQSDRSSIYQTALQTLQHAGHAYPCACSRKDIEQAMRLLGQVKPRNGELVYPGTCRRGLNGRATRAWRLRCPWGVVHWSDRRLGAQNQDVQSAVGDFVLLRADGYFSYQLAVVVDDAAQAITHVVRGEDLSDNTPRQIALQHALGLPTPQYLHTPLVLDANGEKLSKQNGAAPVDTSTPHHAMRALQQAAQVLGLPPASGAGSCAQALDFWVAAWKQRYP